MQFLERKKSITVIDYSVDRVSNIQLCTHTIVMCTYQDADSLSSSCTHAIFSIWRDKHERERERE